MADQSPRNRRLNRTAGIILILLGLGFLLAGGYILYLNFTRADSEGYALSNTVSIRTTAYAFALWLDREPGEPGQLKLVVECVNATKELFVGYARETEGDSYVKGIEYANPLYTGQQIYGWGIFRASLGWTNLTISGRNGIGPSRPPAMETFWLQKLQTKTTTTLYWDPVTDVNAPRTLIVMANSDGSRDIQADIILGYKPWILSWIHYLLMPVGLVAIAAGLILARGT